MKRKRKTVIAGALVKVVEYTPQLPRDTGSIRSARRKATAAAQKALNHKTAQGRLEEKLAANFSNRDYFAVLTYRPGEEPATRKEAKKQRAEFIRKLRTVRRRRGQTLRWIIAIENKHGDSRYHCHAVISSTGRNSDKEEIASLWEHGNVFIKRLFDEDHDCGEDFNSWLQIARYMTKERPEDGPDTTPNGAQLYSCSRNLSSPKTETGWIENSAPLDAPPGAIVLEQEEVVNEFGRFKYIKYLTAPLFRRE